MEDVLKINFYDNAGIVIEDFKTNNIFFTKGERLALQNIPAGEKILQYGVPFAISKGINAGDKITSENTLDIISVEDSFKYSESEHKKYFENLIQKKSSVQKNFLGYHRDDGNVGTRNYYIIFPLSQCASDVAVKIERNFFGKVYKNLDGIISLPNTEGCGCTRHIQIERFLSVIFGFISHPNVVGVLAVELGCEQTNVERIKKYMSEPDKKKYLSKIDFISIEGLGGTKKAVCEGTRILENKLENLNLPERKPTDIKKLILATECGGSDSFSGITANRLIGEVSDYIVDNNGSVILSEITEMIGAEKSIVQRCISADVAKKFKNAVMWYKNIAEKLNESLSDNLVQENINGGLINPTIKSLGAIIKGGTRPISDVLEYAEKIRTQGLNIMQGPGNDIESVTGMSASGANLICFSTGKGTTTGAAVVPVIKISSTKEIYDKMIDDMDFDGEKMLDEKNVETHIENFIKLVIEVASGKRTKSELNDQHQFQVWTAGKLSV